MKMKRVLAICVLGFTFAAGVAADAAPKPGRQGAAKAAPIQMGAITEIQVNEIYSLNVAREPDRPRAGESWTLWSDRVNRSDIQDWKEGKVVGLPAPNLPVKAAALDSANFSRLARYIQSSHLVDGGAQQAANVRRLVETGSALLQISVVRAGKRKSIVVEDIRDRMDDPASLPASEFAGWVVYELMHAITADAEWINAVGGRVDRGIWASFGDYVEGLTFEENTSYDLPRFAVLNAAGKEVAVLRDYLHELNVSSPNGYARHVLPPGTYRLVKKEAAPGTPPAKLPETKGYQWIAVPSTVVVKEGNFTPVSIKLAKIPKAP